MCIRDSRATSSGSLSRRWEPLRANLIRWARSTRAADPGPLRTAWAATLRHVRRRGFSPPACRDPVPGALNGTGQISDLSWPRSPGHDSRSATSSQYYLARNLVAAPRRRRLRRAALWAALIIHARSALVSVRTPLRSVKLNLCYDAGTRQQAHARTTAVAFRGS